MPATEHTCRSIMTAQPVSIRRHESVDRALQMLLQNKLLALPVVDDEGRYFGMFQRSRLVAMLLPRIVQLEERLPEVAKLLEIGFLTDTLDDVQERFRQVASNPVGDYAQTDTPVLRPDTPIMNAVLFLYRMRTYLPVVDEPSGRLIGVVSTWDVLGRIAGDKI
ncbi:MAG: CBS domain-containing protein [Rhodospirillales bacterium]|nr:CBS domain-containing protein [Rhodospirillales bacterium]